MGKFEGMGVQNNKVYLFEQGYVVCLDQQTGNVLWKYNINNNAKYSDVGCLKGAYVIANDGTVKKDFYGKFHTQTSGWAGSSSNHF